MAFLSSPGVYLIKTQLIHTDERGSFSNIPFDLDWSELNLVVTDAGVVRGNHFHRYSTELFLLNEGHIIVESAIVTPNSRGGFDKGELSRCEFRSADIFYISPMTWHRFVIVMPCRWFALMSLPHKTSSHDIIRMD